MITPEQYTWYIDRPYWEYIVVGISPQTDGGVIPQPMTSCIPTTAYGGQACPFAGVAMHALVNVWPPGHTFEWVEYNNHPNRPNKLILVKNCASPNITTHLELAAHVMLDMTNPVI